MVSNLNAYTVPGELYWSQLCLKMPKGKSVSAKRKQRRMQKARKRDKYVEVSSSSQESNECQLFTEKINQITSSECAKSSDSPPKPQASTTTANEVDLSMSRESDEHSAIDKDSMTYLRTSFRTTDIFNSIGHLPPREKNKKLEEWFIQRSDTLHFYKEQVRTLKTEMKQQKQESKRTVKEVRDFWKNKVFNEHSRAGQILKKSGKAAK